jgi:hypothetical protein
MMGQRPCVETEAKYSTVGLRDGAGRSRVERGADPTVVRRWKGVERSGTAIRCGAVRQGRSEQHEVACDGTSPDDMVMEPQVKMERGGCIALSLVV